MLKRIVIGVVALAVAAAVAAAGWYYRPWSPFSPASVRALDDPAAYPETFQRMDEILPSSPIAAPAPSPLERAPAPLEIAYEWLGEDKALDAYLEEGRVTGLTVLRDGVVVAQDFRHGAGPDTRFTSWSVAKSVVAVLIARAVELGLIESLDDPAERYAPQFAGTDYGAVSLRHLLMMSAGVDFNEEYSPERPSDVRPLFFNAFILGRDVDAMVGEIRSNRAPGEDNHYVSPNSHVLSAVVRGAWDAPLAQIVERELWAALGMTGAASWLQNRADGRAIPIGYCCLQATSEDYARFGQFLLQDGVWNGEARLPEGFVNQAGVPNAPFQEPGATPYPGRGYGLHFWVPENYDGEFYAAGVFGQYIWIDRRRGVVIAQNAGDPVWDVRYPEAVTVFRAIAEHVAPLDAGGDDGGPGTGEAGDGGDEGEGGLEP
ncbi:beta-lactamase family protein [Alkalicaulis satelles]|uniref:Beta-lactamase family protein n=1 Tax=Alkalicaulis satelles TaxID=2609175 RepID=A0A5M6ZN37_9PROT|nr:serine hydrolase domain-containing protein [Alkalicaulis satelles]KAA5803701.1 beta-lactamase family protein [Alkalicaulis satelles]